MSFLLNGLQISNVVIHQKSTWLGENCECSTRSRTKYSMVRMAYNIQPT